MVRALGSLVLIVGMIIGVGWLARQKQSLRPVAPARRRLHLIESMPLGAGRSVHLVGCGPKVLLLGSGPDGVAYLVDMPAEAVEFDPQAEPAAPEPFWNQLRAVRLDSFGLKQTGA